MAAPAGPGVPDVTVLVVDDQPPFRDAARSVLDHLAGFTCVGEAASGELAIETVDRLRPDLVLMDINMGGIDGITATAAIVSAHPGVKVVLVSTYELADLPPSARRSGAIAYLNKDDFGGRALRRLWEAGGDPAFATR
jgi:DNA-binding NarL/FixJ family response regulator